MSLVIGLGFLAVAILLADALAGLVSKEGWAWLAKESLIIGGWVALWRPLEIFLLRLVADACERPAVRPAGCDAGEPERQRGRCMSITVAIRALLYFGLWIVIDQSAKPANLLFGVLAAAAATWASLKLLPPAGGRVRLGALLMLLPRFLWQSLRAGVDVARRAFSPRLPLQPGFVDYAPGLPRGSGRNTFGAISSLLPGSVPTGETDQVIEYHALDTAQPVSEQLAAEELAYAKALIPGQRHG